MYSGRQVLDVAKLVIFLRCINIEWNLIIIVDVEDYVGI